MFDCATGVGSSLHSTSSDGRDLLPNRPAEPPWLLPYIDAVGVGSNDPDPISLVRRADVRGSEMMPFDIEPEAGKIGQHWTQATSSQPWHVFGDDNGRFRFIDDAREVRPEPALVVESALFSGEAEWLAWEAAANNVNCSRSHRSDIFKSFCVGPVLRKHAPTPRINLALPRDVAESGLFEAEF